MERIVLGIDERFPLDETVDWIVRRGREKQLSVTVLAATEVMGDEAVPRAAAEEAAAILRRKLPACEVAVEVVPGETCDLLEFWSEHSDLVVVGFHRHHPLTSTLAARRVASRSHCPTVIVPDDWTPRVGSIVAGVDDDRTSDVALLFAAREADQRARHLDVVHAWLMSPTAFGAAAELLIDPAELLGAHREVLAAATHGIRTAFPEVSMTEYLDEQNTADAVLARASHAELIVIGTHRHGPIAGLVLGATAGAVLRHSSTPVCVVPSADRRPAARSGERLRAQA